MTSNNITQIWLDAFQVLINAQNNLTSQEIQEAIRKNNIETQVIEPIAVVDPLEKIIPIELKLYDVNLNSVINWFLTQTATSYNRFGIEFTFIDDEGPGNEPYGFNILLQGSNTLALISWDSEKDVLGNPKFPGIVYKKSFDISELINLTQISINFYGTAVLNNIRFIVGFDMEGYATLEKSPLTIYGEEKKLSYSDKNEQKNIYLQWIYNVSADTFAAITSQSYNTEIDTELALAEKQAQIKWYEYDKNSDTIDTILGTGWLHQPAYDNKLIYSIAISEDDLEKEYKQIQAVIIHGVESQIVKSNILTIKNTAVFNIPSAISNMRLQLEDGTNGNYMLYDYDMYLAQQNWHQSIIPRLASVEFQVDSGTRDKVFSSIKTIQWKIPSNVGICDDKINSNLWQKEQTADHTILIKSNYFMEDDLNLEYNIPQQINKDAAFSDNLSCEIIFKDGRSFKAETTLVFGFISAGEDYRIISRLYNNKAEIVINQAKLLNSNDSDYIEKLHVFNREGKEIIIESTDINAVETSAWYTIKRATLPNTATALVCYYAFPYSSSLNYYYKGPTKIIYNARGVEPKYDTSSCELYGSFIPEGRWELVDDKGINIGNNQNEILGFDATRNILLPKASYLPHMAEREIYVQYVTDENTIIWKQPIIIMQETNFSAIIDEWDGGLSIDEKGNYIMASAYVAGSKDQDGTFTGTILGELKTIIDNSEAKESGLFGYHQGAQSFGFKTDGTAFLGKAGEGRINFDGNGGLIYSGNFELENKFTVTSPIRLSLNDFMNKTFEGTYFGLQDGLLATQSGIFGPYILSAKSFRNTPRDIDLQEEGFYDRIPLECINADSHEYKGGIRIDNSSLVFYPTQNIMQFQNKYLVSQTWFNNKGFSVSQWRKTQTGFLVDCLTYGTTWAGGSSILTLGNFSPGDQNTLHLNQGIQFDSSGIVLYGNEMSRPFFYHDISNAGNANPIMSLVYTDKLYINTDVVFNNLKSKSLIYNKEFIDIGGIVTTHTYEYWVEIAAGTIMLKGKLNSGEEEIVWEIKGSEDFFGYEDI